MAMIPQSDTDFRVLPAPASEADADAKPGWVKSACANLQRHAGSGRYRAFAKVGGRLIRKVFKTKSLAVARTHLDALLKVERAKRLEDAPDVDGFRFKQLANAWLAKVEANQDLKPRAKDYRRETLEMLRRVCPEIDKWKPADVSRADCDDVAAKLRTRYSAYRFNGALETLRGIFQMAITRQMMVTNPAALVERASLPVREKKELPPMAKFRKLLRTLDANPSRARAALMVRFLVYSGARPAAARLVLPAHVDLKRNELRLPPIKHQHQVLVIPMSEELRAVTKKLLAGHPGGARPLVPIANPRRALRTVCRELGLPAMTPYDLRHLFTTHLLENDVPVPVVAALRGDKDGGRMLLKTYAHIRDERMQRAMKQVKW